MKEDELRRFDSLTPRCPGPVRHILAQACKHVKAHAKPRDTVQYVYRIQDPGSRWSGGSEDERN